MTPLLLTCTCLLLPCCVPVAPSSNQLQFYRDGVAEVADGIALRELGRYLERQEQHDRTLAFSDLSPFLMRQLHKKYHLEADQVENEGDLLKALSDESKLAGIFRKGKLDEWNDRREREYGLAMELERERERQRLGTGRKEPDYDKSYYGTNLLARMKDYTREDASSKLSYFPSGSAEKESLAFSNQANLPYRIQVPWLQHKESSDSFEKSMKEQPVYHSHFHHHQERESNSGNSAKYLVHVIPEFSFRFDDSNLGEKHPFAVKPNDPRYYRESAFFSDPREKNEEELPAPPHVRADGSTDLFSADTRSPPTHQAASQPLEEDMLDKTANNNKFNDISMLAINDLNNDIYFIAIVAGCSAAAMFALVLTSLTWCRLQRGVKAAADIEYPAYGVTGPNKDVSPSGDQRLAHSAQMYHFQHQKQQIIAMENRASAGRDPGSVSEAESDEENDEGHHTVYECPGLASTGELEVKNPLFQDDSMPITPAQSTKEEDHM